MKERPILFSAPMVSALLDGSKTQTRRIAKFPEGTTAAEWVVNKQAVPDGIYTGWVIDTPAPLSLPRKCPYGQPGDQLWVREAWRTYASLDGIRPREIAPGAGIQYEALGTNLPGDKGDYLLGMGKYRPSMFMPRLASRITLEVVDVRVERLQDISEADAEAEGWTGPILGRYTAYHWYLELWESINGKGSWDANPWVWVIEFRRIK